MNNSEIFIEKYKHFEALIRSSYDLRNDVSLVSFLNSLESFKPFRESFRYIQDVRNILQHKYKINNEYPVEVSKSLIDELDRIAELFSNRKRCKDIMTPFKKVYTADIDDSLEKVISSLSDKMYNHVPILTSNRLCGVFDEISLYEMHIKGVRITPELKFKDIKQFITLNSRRNEKFIFFNENAYIDELIREFDRAYDEGKRIGLVFLNTTGKIDNFFTGIISTNDILGRIL